MIAVRVDPQWIGQHLPILTVRGRRANETAAGGISDVNGPARIPEPKSG